jgi:NAD(P)-dependent dehydrogenase (short-subunit alcohol dehydrogenase family)
MSPIEKPVAIVTGSSKGIGRGIALRLAREGYALVVNGRNATGDAIEGGPFEVKTRIEQEGGTAEVCLGDIASTDDRRRLVDSTLERFGRIDLLVNNAGVAPSQRRDILEATEESFERLIAINLEGPYFLTQRVANRMIELKKQGIVPCPRIAFITSISAYTSSTARGEYCVSKAGLSMAAQLYAHRLAEYDIPVIEICPGIIQTSMTRGVQEKYDKLIAEGLLPTARWGQPEDVAAVVSAFARGDLDYSTGTRIEVGGGFGLRRL